MGGCCGKSDSVMQYEARDPSSYPPKPYEMKHEYSDDSAEATPRTLDKSPSKEQLSPTLDNSSTQEQLSPTVTIDLSNESSVDIPKKEYKAAKGDKVDEALARIINSNDVQLPIYRIAEGKYLIGTESKMCLIKGTSCVVRVGGGFQKLEEYLKRN